MCNLIAGASIQIQAITTPYQASIRYSHILELEVLFQLRLKARLKLKEGSNTSIMKAQRCGTWSRMEKYPFISNQR